MPDEQPVQPTGPMGPHTGTYAPPHVHLASDSDRAIVQDLIARAQKRVAQDPYGAGPCPSCGQFAIGAERGLDGDVACPNGHRWKRAHAARPPETKPDAVFGFHVRVAKNADGVPQLAVTDAADMNSVHFSIGLEALPTPGELNAIVEGMKKSCADALSSLERRLRNPGLSDLIDRMHGFTK